MAGFALVHMATSSWINTSDTAPVLNSISKTAGAKTVRQRVLYSDRRYREQGDDSDSLQAVQATTSFYPGGECSIQFKQRDSTAKLLAMGVHAATIQDVP